MRCRIGFFVELPEDVVKALTEKANQKGMDVDELIVEIMLDYLDDIRVAERVIQKIGDLSDW